MERKTYKVAPTHGLTLWSRKMPVIPIPLQVVTMATIKNVNIYGCLHMKILDLA